MPLYPPTNGDQNRKHEQWWWLCTCHGLSMSHSRPRTAQIPLTLLLTGLSVAKLKTQTQAQDDNNSHPPAQCLHMGLLRETQPSESKAFRNLKRQHPDSFNVFWIAELTLNPEAHENSSDTPSSSQPTPENKEGSTCLCHHPLQLWVHLMKPQNGLNWKRLFKGPLIQAPCHKQGHLQLDQIFQIFLKCTEINHLQLSSTSPRSGNIVKLTFQQGLT